jgi:hypothetical protein
MPKNRQGEFIQSGAVMAILKTADIPQSESEELLALGRMVSFACQRANQLNLEMSTYCLEMALTSLVQDMGEREIQTSVPGDRPLVLAVSDLH